MINYQPISQQERRKTGDRSPKSEERSPKKEVGGPETEVRRKNSKGLWVVGDELKGR